MWLSISGAFSYKLCHCKRERQNIKMSSKNQTNSGLTSLHCSENSRSGLKLRILDRFQTPQNANKSVQPTNFHESVMSKKSQTVKSSQTDNVCAPFKCDIMVVKRL